MMTKVEELRFSLLVAVRAYTTLGDGSGAEEAVDALAAAALLREVSR
jgi:hypothetical protein